jgi:16S rRNA (uracil1498-N3)-methyltransferase
MQLFYTTDFIDDHLVRFRDSEWRHCHHVLRYQEGDIVHFVDGKGSYFKGIIDSAGKKEGMIKIQEHIRQWNSRPYEVHIAIAPTKNVGRIEWALEKMLEIGLDRISLLQCKRSERKVVKVARLEKIAISAMKQSLQAKLPIIDEMLPFHDFVQANSVLPEQSRDQVGLIAHLSDQSKPVFQNYIPGKDVIILIGPEGDFTQDEISLAVENGFKMIHLGQNRLRTETAALAACHSIHLINEMK